MDIAPAGGDDPIVGAFLRRAAWVLFGVGLFAIPLWVVWCYVALFMGWDNPLLWDGGGSSDSGPDDHPSYGWPVGD